MSFADKADIISFSISHVVNDCYRVKPAPQKAVRKKINNYFGIIKKNKWAIRVQILDSIDNQDLKSLC